ncbi:MAG: hypothetical protein ACSLE1_07800 [Sphingobium sp.]
MTPRAAGWMGWHLGSMLLFREAGDAYLVVSYLAFPDKNRESSCAPSRFKKACTRPDLPTYGIEEPKQRTPPYAV